MKTVEHYSPVYYTAQGGSDFWICGRNPKVWSFRWKLLSNTLLLVLFITQYEEILTFEPVDEILKYDHSNESYWAVLSYGVGH